MKSLKKIDFKILIPLLFLVPFFTGTLFLFKQTQILPLICGIVLASFIFLFKGKYRAYALLFFIPLTAFLSFKPFGIKLGSLLTWDIVLYGVVVLIENIHFYKENKGPYKRDLFLAVFFLIIFMFISNLVNFKTVSLIKYCSIIAYWLLPVIFFEDQKCEKNIFKMILAFSSSFILSNIFCAFFVYVAKPYSKLFLTTYISKYVDNFAHINIANFRFTGMIGDSNHNAFIALLISSISLFYIKFYNNHKLILISNILVLQIFALLGGSKTYIVAFLVLYFLFVFLFLKDSKFFIYIFSISVFLILSALILMASIPALSKTLTRLLLFDDRTGFLESITSNRASIWREYFAEMTKNPLLFLIGHGTQTKRLYEADYHNSYIELIWEYGMVGTLIWINYFKFFLIPKSTNSKLIKTIFIVLILLFGFSLHIIYNELFYAALLINYVLSNKKSNSLSINI